MVGKSFPEAKLSSFSAGFFISYFRELFHSSLVEVIFYQYFSNFLLQSDAYKEVYLITKTKLNSNEKENL